MANGVWTNNWRGIKNLMLLGNVMPGLTTIVRTDGNLIPANNPSSCCYALSPLSAYSAVGGYNTIRVGTGSAAPAASDVNLAAPANVNYLSFANESLVCDVEHGTAAKTVKVVVQNRAGESITLTEWGILSLANGGNSTNHEVLVYRELLDTPVTLSPNQAATLTLTLTLTLDDPI